MILPVGFNKTAAGPKPGNLFEYKAGYKYNPDCSSLETVRVVFIVDLVL